jgi:tetratricopeptide (TPR) repeat protein
MYLNRSLGENAVPAYRLFSLVYFSRQRINDALEYISFALEQAERTAQREELLITCYYASSINFLYGNLSKAERLAARAAETALEIGYSQWGMRAKFLRGRINFEAGRYGDALDLFESLLVKPNKMDKTVTQSQEMIHTVQAWIFRARNFLVRFSPGSKRPEKSSGNVNLTGPDTRLFEIEAAYFTADYERAAALAGDFLSSAEDSIELVSRTDFIITEQPDWESGFSQCEYMFRPEKTHGTKLAWLYKAMAQCALNAPREEKVEILGNMQRFMREELLPDTDPNDTCYFHAWYCMLRDSQDFIDADSYRLDMNTIVGMAFRRLQRRASKIDDTETKQSFINQSRWSNTLYLAAKEHRLMK